jgi:hypothetical protein
MQLKLLLFSIISPLFLFAQTKISGRVFDKESQEPISNVVVYTDEKITATDSNGNYHIDVKPSEQAYFRQLAYDFFVCSSDTLLLNPDIFLTQNVVNLGEVVIAPENAQILLNKAIQNLYVRLQKNKTKSYLYHIEETTDTGGSREVYASIDAGLSSINKNNGALDWNINLVQLDKKNTLEENFRPKKMRIARVGLFPKKISVLSEPNEYIYKFYENDDDQITIRVLPRKSDKEHYRYYLFTISRQDTILTEYISQSFPNVSDIASQKFLSLTRQILNHFTRLKYGQDELSNAYYLKEAQNTGGVKMTINSLTSVFSFKVNSKEISLDPINSTKKKIKPYDYVLFETDFPNSPGFWKKYVK